MKFTSFLILNLLTGAAMAETINFDSDKTGSVPAAWNAGVTGRGSPKWAVEQDATAPSKPNVLKQSGSGTFPYCVLKQSSLADGYVEVKFKPLAGKEDQAGGIIWRFKNADNYYVARANALENNLSSTTPRTAPKTSSTSTPGLRKRQVRCAWSSPGSRSSRSGRQDPSNPGCHIAGAGAVGVWTKADSVTAFDDFQFGAAAK
jgi:hypothetical protein